jgi:hypothetical protein
VVLWIINAERKVQAVDMTIDWDRLGRDRATTKASSAETGQDHIFAAWLAEAVTRPWRCPQRTGEPERPGLQST